MCIFLSISHKEPIASYAPVPKHAILSHKECEVIAPFTKNWHICDSCHYIPHGRSLVFDLSMTWCVIRFVTFFHSASLSKRTCRTLLQAPMSILTKITSLFRSCAARRELPEIKAAVGSGCWYPNIVWYSRDLQKPIEANWILICTLTRRLVCTQCG